jgi:solute carrier family 25 2-oxodicarboxylate transporter 21
MREVGTVDFFTRGSTTELTVAGTLFAGFLTGYPEAAGVTPFEVVKVRLQSLDHVGKYRDSMQCAKRIVKEEGISALYRGFGATCARNCTFNGIFFGVVKAAREGFGLDHNPAADFFLGIGAAFVATCFKLPFDIAKSRIQNQLPVPASTSTSGPKVVRYTGVLQCLSTVAKDEGMAAL